jgi:nitroreductase
VLAYPEPVTGLIRKRVSWRSYRDISLTPEQKGRIEGFISSMDPPPFGTRVRLALADSHLPGKARMPGTYGVIKGARAILVGALIPSPMGEEDFGWAFEAAVLFCTALGLGTCWMGGTLDRDFFGNLIGLEPGEFIPAVSPVGAMESTRTLVDSLFAIGSGSRKRKPFSELFFTGDLSTPLDESKCGEYAEALRMVRLAPSATNRQPWRVVSRDGAFHFFLARSRGYKAIFGQGADLQRLDMGIAMLHFEAAARGLGLAGSWKRLDGAHGITHPPEVEYRFSWVTGG